MNPKSPEARIRDDNPFEGLIIMNSEVLNKLVNRSSCRRCCKSRMYFCYTCFIPVAQLENHVPLCNVKYPLSFKFGVSVIYDQAKFYEIIVFQLPIKVDIIKHRREIDGKSTAAHAAVLAPQDVNVYTYPDIPTYSNNGRTVLLFPGTQSYSVQGLFTNKQNCISYSERMLAELPSGYNVGSLRTKLIENDNVIDEIYHSEKLPIDRLVIIDSTWNQSRGIYADKRIRSLPTVVLQNRVSQFWRHQKGSPRWYLSTIEALHQFLLELHVCAWGCSEEYKSYLTSHYPKHTVVDNHPQCIPYNGDYDNLLFFFKFMYEKLHKLYKHEDLLSYQRPMQ